MKALNILVVLVFLVQNSFGQVKLPPIKSEIKMSDDGVETVFPVITMISFNTVGEIMDVKAGISISFQNFQSNQTQILKQSLEEHDDCGKRLKLTGSNFSEERGLAFLTVNLRYEQWVCAFGGTTCLVRQSGKIKIKLTPQIENSTLFVRSEVVDVEANGALGSLLDNDSFKREFVKLIGLDDRLEAALPKELSSLNPDFGSFNFSTSQGVIFLMAEAIMHLTGTQLSLLMAIGNDD